MRMFAALGGIRQTHARQWPPWVESQVLGRVFSYPTPRLTLQWETGGTPSPSCWRPWAVVRWPPSSLPGWTGQDRTEQNSKDSREWAGVKNDAHNFLFTCLQML